jgi:hypothetical protein
MTSIPKASHAVVSRSPTYPSIDLRSAIERARVVFQEVGRHPTSVEVIAKIWGYKSTSGTFKANVAAVRAFGFLEAHADGRHRLEKLSPAALDIVADFPQGSEPWQEAVKTSALRPRIHQSMWERYSHHLPADDELRRHLVREKSFTDAAVGDFIKQYKSTLEFAQLAPAEAHARGGGPGEVRRQEREIAVLNLPDASHGAHQVPPQQRAVREAAFTLDSGRVVVQWPDRLSTRGFEDLRDFLQLVIKKAESSMRDDAAGT